jgi:DNA-binding beta-propeller fold protein YncE
VRRRRRGAPADQIGEEPIGLTPVGALCGGDHLSQAWRHRPLRGRGIAPGKDPVTLVESGEDTRPPMTTVGTDRAALVIGPEESADIAVVALNTGRILKRIKAPVAPTNLGASPDGATLYVSAGGSISAIAIDTGHTRTLTAGDSFVVDPDSGDLIVRLDESPRYRLVRVTPKGDTVPIAMNGDLRMIPYPLSPGSIRHGKLVLPVASADSWYWYVAILDLATGDLKRVNVRPDLDFHAAAWAPDGRIIGYGFGTNITLWKFSQWNYFTFALRSSIEFNTTLCLLPIPQHLSCERSAS